MQNLYRCVDETPRLLTNVPRGGTFVNGAADICFRRSAAIFGTFVNGTFVNTETHPYRCLCSTPVTPA